MAAMTTEAAMSFAVGKLRELMIEKVMHLRGIEEQVNRLRNELKTMQSFLRDATEKPTNNSLIRRWVSDIREVAQDAEAAIETFILNVENPKKFSGMLKRCVCFPNHLSNLDTVRESIRTRLDDIEKIRLKYEIKNLGEAETFSSRIRHSDLSVSRPYGADKDVGLEDDIDLLFEKAVSNDRDGLFVTTIVGIGVFLESLLLPRKCRITLMLLQSFQFHAWVCVSEDFNPQNIKELVTGPGDKTNYKYWS